MCWNATTSMTSFIFGVIISIIIGYIALKQKKYSLAILSFGWTWVICMQLFEFFIWNSKDENKNISKLTYIFNVTQILVLGLLFLSFTKNNYISKIIVVSVLLLYTSYILYYSDISNVTVNKDCHLSYNWWDKIPFGGIIYTISLICIFLLIVKPFYWSLYTTITIILFLLLSCLFYSNNVASMWCFFAVIVPIISYVISCYTY